MKKNILPVTAVVILYSFIFFSYPPTHKAGWLIGNWVNHRHNGDIYENWVKTSDSLLTGKSYKLRGTDTILLETVQLLQRENTLFFIPVVTGQNGEKAVSFKEIPGKDGALLFENKEHDFPQIISYRLITPDSLVAEISGNQKGKFRHEIFPMKRVPQTVSY